jgi:hypothetical protein
MGQLQKDMKMLMIINLQETVKPLINSLIFSYLFVIDPFILGIKTGFILFFFI